MTYMTFTPGTTIYVGTEMRYIGRATVESIESAQVLIVRTADGRRGRVAADQAFPTAKEAKANVKGAGEWSSAAQLLGSMSKKGQK